MLLNLPVFKCYLKYFSCFKADQTKHFCEPTIWNPYPRASSNVLCLCSETKPQQTGPWPKSPSAPRSALVAVSEDQGSAHCQSSFPHTLMRGGARHKSKAKASKLQCGSCTPSSLGQPECRSLTFASTSMDHGQGWVSALGSLVFAHGLIGPAIRGADGLGLSPGAVGVARRVTVTY